MPYDSNGRTGGRELNYSEMFAKWGQSVALLDHIASSSWRGDTELRGLSLRVPQTVGGEWLCVIKAFNQEGGPVVAFHSGQSGAEAIAGAIQRMQAGSLNWKDDEFYGR